MTKFYTYNEYEKSLKQAPRVITRDGSTLVLGAPEDYARYLGAYPRGTYAAPPEVPEGKMAVEDGYELVDGEWRNTWRIEDAPLPSIAEYDAAMEAHLADEKAARGYTTREPDVYINSQVPRWAQDARDWIAHRDAVMLYAIEIMNRVAAGEPQPTLADFKAGLPRIEWTIQEVD